nr:hypothetical protein [Thermobacillus sp. ZCTH02-B1]
MAKHERDHRRKEARRADGVDRLSAPIRFIRHPPQEERQEHQHPGREQEQRPPMEHFGDQSARNRSRRSRRGHRRRYRAQRPPPALLRHEADGNQHRERRNGGGADPLRDPGRVQQRVIRREEAEDRPGGEHQDSEGGERLQAEPVRQLAVEKRAGRVQDAKHGDDPARRAVGQPEFGDDVGQRHVEHRNVHGGERDQAADEGDDPFFARFHHPIPPAQ